MKVRVQYFSQLKELAGRAEEEVELPEEATVEDLLAQLYQRHAALASWERHLLFGSGVEFVERTHRLHPGEAIALMPPVQGG